MARFDTVLGFSTVATLFALVFFVEMLPRMMTLLILTICLVLGSLVGLALLLFRRRPPK